MSLLLCYAIVFFVIISASLSISIVSISANGVDLSSIPSVGQSLCRSIRKVYCGKMADWIQMPFGMVSGGGQGMGVLDGVVIIKGEGAVLGVNLGHPIVTNGEFVALLCGSA